MKAFSLAGADQVYTCGAGVRIRYHAVVHPALRAYCTGLAKLEHELGDLRDDEQWQAFLRPARMYRFRMCATPLSADQQLDMCCEAVERLRPQLHDFADLFTQVDAAHAHTLLDWLESVGQSGESPLLDKTADVLVPASAGDRAVLVKDTKLLPLAEEAMAGQQKLKGVEVLAPASVRGSRCLHQLVVVGPPRWFPEDIFSAPRALRIDVVNYSWFRDRWEAHQLFEKSLLPKQPKAETTTAVHEDEEAGEGDVLGPEDMIPVANLAQAVAQLGHGGTDEGGEDAVEAQGYYLAGGMAVFLETDEKASVLSLDLNEDDQHRVKRVKVGDVEPGTYILLRTAGGGDYIVPVADEIMGDRSSEARTYQRTWKAKLRAVVEQRGLANTCRLLAAEGCQRAYEQNVKNWMWARNIHTETRADFQTIMRITGLEAAADEYWRQMEFITHAHMKAGMLIRRRLFKELARADLRKLERYGRLDIALPGTSAVSLTAFRIEGVAASVEMVPLHHLYLPFGTGVV